MRIEHVEVTPYALPFREPYVTAVGELRERQMVLLRLRTNDGYVGLGEGVPLSLRGDSSLADVVKAITEVSARLDSLDLAPAVEDPLPFAAATMIELSAPKRLPGAAIAAIESALFDVVARCAEIPLWRLLGAQDPEPVICNATLTAGEPDAVAAQARAWAAEGFRTFKLKLGAGFDDFETVSAVREAIGEEARIRVDLNQALGSSEAIELLADIEPFDIELAEQPAAGLRNMARIAQASPIPLAADESVAGEADAHRAKRAGACTYATIKLSKVGGIGPAKQVASVLPSYLSSALDGPVGIAAAAHAAQALREEPGMPEIAHGLATQRLFTVNIARHGCTLDEGRLLLPDGDGLGVELEEAELDRLRI